VIGQRGRQPDLQRPEPAAVRSKSKLDAAGRHDQLRHSGGAKSQLVQDRRRLLNRLRGKHGPQRRPELPKLSQVGRLQRCGDVIVAHLGQHGPEPDQVGQPIRGIDERIERIEQQHGQVEIRRLLVVPPLKPAVSYSATRSSLLPVLSVRPVRPPARPVRPPVRVALAATRIARAP
jgi:hypothetical protein